MKAAFHLNAKTSALQARAVRCSSRSSRRAGHRTRHAILHGNSLVAGTVTGPTGLFKNIELRTRNSE